ncbi:MAG: hypothetical protein NTV05_06950 [Acidobacteria bacterium]|nr:hypothetical protein [Acidobacteriota bacterium]
MPIPGRGYWRRKETGHKVRPTPLPKDSESTSLTIRIDRPNLSAPPPATADLHPLAAFERQPENRIIVDEDVEATHKMFRATRQYWSALRNHEPDAAKLPHLDIQVSADARPRALRILQSLLAAFDHRGFELETGSDGNCMVKVLQQAVGFRIEESTKDVLHQRTAKEEEAVKRGVSTPRWDHMPNGRLTLKIVRRWGVGRRVADTASRRLEERLNEFIELLVEQALIQRAEQAEAERKERERLEAERRRKEAAERRREEEARIAGFEQIMAAWKRTKARRACLAEVREAAGPLETDAELARWLTWATGYVDKNDPVRRVREREQTITLHFAASYGSEHVLSKGFEERESSPRYGEKPIPPGILLSDYAWIVQYGGKDIAFDVPEDAVIPFECSEDDDWARMFRVPARVLNRIRKIGPAPIEPSPDDDADDVDEDVDEDDVGD